MIIVCTGCVHYMQRNCWGLWPNKRNESVDTLSHLVWHIKTMGVHNKQQQEVVIVIASQLLFVSQCGHFGGYHLAQMWELHVWWWWKWQNGAKFLRICCCVGRTLTSTIKTPCADVCIHHGDVGYGECTRSVLRQCDHGGDCCCG